MVHTPGDSAANLLMDMKPDLDSWIASGDEIDFQGKYEAAIRSAGLIPFFSELFRRLEDSRLSAYLSAFTFLWKDLPFSAWQQILYRISDSTQAVYQFVWFASQFLGVDILAMIRTDPKVDDNAREFIRAEFSKGAPRSGSWERESLEERGVNPEAMWRRLASEGAPMKIDLHS